MSVPLSGYATIRLLRASPNTRVYEAERKRDGRRVIAKVFALTDDAIEARVMHEFRVLQSLAGRAAGEQSIAGIEGVVEVLGLERAGSELVLLLAHVDGHNLAQYAAGRSLALHEFLRIATRLAGILAAVHERRVIHRDVKPSNILIEARSGDAFLADFGISVLLEDTHRRVYDPDVIAGTLPYLSPEQTGRTRREVDSRSDLYSLGVTFFELLTGRLPFIASAPLELIHAHLARRPSAPISLRPELPNALSNLILKLLEKAPEHRYQSARGLLADLTRIAAGEPSFELGRDDVSTTLQLPHQLYGRAREQQALTAEFEAVVATARSRLLVVSGAPGQGKSALIHSVEIPLSKRAGYLAIGKYERSRDELPYAGFVQACAALLEQILTESDERLELWRTRLHSGLGPLASVVAQFVPMLELVLGELERPPTLELADARARLHRSLIRFVTVFARHAPLVLALDDMQWADGGSVELLAALLYEDPDLPLLILAVEREAERAPGQAPDPDDELLLLRPEYALADMLETLGREGRAQRLELRPLAREDLELLLADVLGRPQTELAELAGLVARKTENNPLFVRQFLVHLRDLELLRVGPGGWTWDISAIAAARIPNDVLGVMAAKLERLPVSARELLELGACIGLRFELGLLTELVEVDPETITRTLYELELAGLITGLAHAHQFSHERLREAVLERLEPGRRRAHHRAIGRRLLARQREDIPQAGRGEVLGERVFEIVDQLDLGFTPDDPPTLDERDELLALDVEAGERALGSGAWSSALRYFSSAVSLLGSGALALLGASAVTRLRATAPLDPGSSGELEFRARFGHAQALALAGHTNMAARAFDELLTWKLSLRQLGQLVARRVRILIMQGQTEAALAFGLANLARCGAELRRDPALPRVLLEAARAWRLARRIQLEDLLEQPDLADDRTHARLDIIDALKIPAYLIDQRLYALLVAQHAYVTLRDGFHPTGPQALAQLAFVAASFGLGERAGVLAQDAVIVAQQRATTVAARTGALRATQLFVAHQFRSFRACVEPLPELYGTMIEAGDRLHAGFVGGVALVMHMEAGTHLRDFVALGQLFCRENPSWGSSDGAANANFSLRYAATLADASGQGIGFLTRDMPEVVGCSTLVRMSVDAVELSGLTLLGERERAWAIVEALGETYERVMFGHFFVPRIALFSIMLACDRLHDGAPERNRLRSLVRARTASLARWARRCPINFEVMAMIASAELAAIDGRSREAELAYERAASLADESGITYLEGLAYLRLAGLARRERRSAAADGGLRAARSAFERWGAWAIVARLEREHPELGSSRLPSPSEPTTSGSTPQPRETFGHSGLGSSMDLGSVLATLQAISEDLQLDEVVTRVLAAAIENAGADRGVLLLERAEGMAIVALGDSAAAVELVGEPIRLADAEQQLATSAVHYVLRTGTAIVVDELRDDPRFAGDRYVGCSGVRSLLCMPIVKQSQRVGALVLENRLHGASFTPARLEVLRVLVGQAASALDNARLFAALGRSEAQWRSLVDGVPDVIMLLDLRGTIEFCNRGDERLHGHSFEQLLEPDAIPIWREAIAAALARVEQSALELQLEFPGAGKRWFMTRIAAIETEGKVGKLLVISTDISERKAFEAKLQQQQRLEAIGTLASGVAHEINNPVQAILNYTELIEDAIESPELVREFNGEIAGAGKRVAAIVRNLLAFARQDRTHDPEFEPCEVRVLIEDTLSLIHAVLRKDRIKLALELAADLPQVRCRRQQIQQILMNLVTNARDAINEHDGASSNDDRKHITIRATSVTRNGASWVRIAVEDRAGGIPESIRARVFDPFFTTKLRDQGTGLGLSVSHGIASEHGGELGLETEVGVGTTFFLLLPGV